MRKTLQGLLGIAVLAGCGSFAEPTPPESWLEYASCDAPCWQGITPGETPVDEAVNILEHELNAQDIVIRELNFSPSHDGGISWTLPVEEGGDGEARWNNQTIIWLRVNDNTCLSTIVEKYGEPTHVSVRHPPDRPMEADVFWLQHGFMITVDRKSIRRGLVDENLCAQSIYFYAPVTNPEGAAIGSRGRPMPWHGYDSLESYKD